MLGDGDVGTMGWRGVLCSYIRICDDIWSHIVNIRPHLSFCIERSNNVN